MSNIQDAVLKSIDTLVSNRIDKIKADKTIVAQISTCVNALTGEYRLTYQGGFITAFAAEGASYRQNVSVYVLVPLGDFTNKKHIVGPAQTLENDQNISFVASALSNYNLIGKNPITNNFKTPPNDSWGVTSYIKDNYVMLYDRDIPATPQNQLLSIDEDEMNNNIKEAEALMIEASFLTNLPREHRVTKTGIYGVQFVLAFADQDKRDEDGNPAINTYSYVLDTNNMTGNPLMYQKWNDQYAIYPIDTANFLYVQSIMFFANDFVTKDDIVNASLTPNNIWVKDLEIYGLKEITSVNGDYKLSLSMPQGNTLRSISSDEKVSVVAKMAKLQDNLSEATTFYWFAADGRITPQSEDYQMYGGSGWRRLKAKGSKYEFSTSGYENRAYENKYLCVAVYQETMILKSEFVIYNNSCKRDITISSSLGERFSFDRGIPKLTCLINGKEADFEDNKPDRYFTFIWSKVDESGQVFTFNQTLEEVEKEKQTILQDPEVEKKAGLLLALNEKMAQLQDVEFEVGKNTITYPVKNIKGVARFKCSVFLRDSDASDSYAIGEAEIVLVNENAATPNDYYIVIENGDQVFQYSESGVAPDNERYPEEERLKIKPLSVRFYDPAGMEVNPKTYSVQWIAPIDNSMLSNPKGLQMNPATEKIELLTGDLYPVEIKQSYDFQALNNQVRVIITYNKQEYTAKTTFLFAKIGENGTNGTDVVAKIDPISPPSKGILMALLDANGALTGWSNGESPSSEVLRYKLFARNEPVTITGSVLWQINGRGKRNSTTPAATSGITNKFMTVNGSGTDASISWNQSNWGKNSPTLLTQLIVQARTTLDGTTYYTNYGIVVAKYNSTDSVVLDDTYTLRSILYNADGRNPLYNKNQGIFLQVLDGSGEDVTSNRFIEYVAEGGDTQPDFKLITEKNDIEGYISVAGLGKDHVYILPNDSYSGLYTNNLVHVRIWNKAQTTVTTEVLIPLNLSLNTYGLASLNSWDGNTVRIDEEENYILAPQIGAGEKDSQNRFTGVVMGKVETYDQPDSSKTSKEIGLVGYSAGQQSIFLDAESGNAYFGLPESDMGTEGRIEMVPGGESKIGSWRIADTSLYNIRDMGNTTANKKYYTRNYKGEMQLDARKLSRYSDLSSEYPFSIPHDKAGVLISAEPQYISLKGGLLDNTSTIDYNAANTVVQYGDAFELELNPVDSSIFTLFRHTNGPQDGIALRVVENFTGVDGKGTYIIDYNNTSYARLASNNTWHLITPVSGSSNRYYVAKRHVYGSSQSVTWSFHVIDISKAGGYYTKAPEGSKYTGTFDMNGLSDAAVWRRDAKVGINNQGRFYTNALKDSTTALTIGSIGAFGQNALSNSYSGATFEVGSGANSNTLVKMFTDSADLNKKAGTLYVSGATDTTSEYQRPMKFYGKSIGLFSSTNSSTDKDSDYKISVDQTKVEAKAGNSVLNLVTSNNNSTPSYITTSGTFNITTTNKAPFNLNVGATSFATNAMTENNNGNRTANVTGAYNITATGNYSLTAANGNAANRSNLTLGASQASLYTYQSGIANTSLLTLRNGGTSNLRAYSNLDIRTNVAGASFNIVNENSANGIVVTATKGKGTSRLSLTPTDDGNSRFSLTSGYGSIGSNTGTVNGVKGTNYISFTNGITNWLEVTGNYPNSNRGVYVKNVCEANSFYFHEELKSGNVRMPDNSTKYCNTISVWTHLENIYSMLSANGSLTKSGLDSKVNSSTYNDGISNLQNQINSKASSSALNSLSSTVDDKANKKSSLGSWVGLPVLPLGFDSSQRVYLTALELRIRQVWEKVNSMNA